MSDDEGYRPDLRDKARRAFDAVRAKDFPSRAEDAVQWHAKHYVQLRSAEVREKMRDHFAKMEPVWTRREIEKLRRENPKKPELNRADGPRSPLFAASYEASREMALANRAHANVKGRCDERLKTVDDIEHRMMRQIKRSRSR